MNKAVSSMKVRKDYWYGNYTEINRNTHDDRYLALRPSGVFLLDGMTLPRTNLNKQTDQKKLISTVVEPNLFNSVHTINESDIKGTCKSDILMRSSKDARQSMNIIQETPHELRIKQIKAYKNIFFEDKFTRNRVRKFYEDREFEESKSNNKELNDNVTQNTGSQTNESSTLPSLAPHPPTKNSKNKVDNRIIAFSREKDIIIQAERIWFPSKQNHMYLEKLIER